MSRPRPDVQARMSDEERLARLRAGQPGPMEQAARTLLERSPDVARLLGLSDVLEEIDHKRNITTATDPERDRT